MRELAAADAMLRDAALRLVQDEHGVRVEDYLATLAAATGEAVIVSSGLFDIEHNDLTPGSAVFGDELNRLLSGDEADLASAPATSVTGLLRDRLVPDVVAAADVAPIGDLYRQVAATVGEAPWGDVAVTVAPDHRHRVLPLQMAFALRDTVASLQAHCEEAFRSGSEIQPTAWGRHVLCAHALASAVAQTAEALDPRVGLTLALQITFAMAKTVPMARTTFEELQQHPG
jgi:hypothetical protein